ncbi:Fc receptor-like protein 2 [Polyodon spathula]|uniref:Fc receptor-like protein 2 n=1 Tax=Polyodon spathula TaxID=7913 RepID=UPI001B7F5478|nr:Fc receptor-like protein 2 [Polyodon spathula]
MYTVLQHIVGGSLPICLQLCGHAFISSFCIKLNTKAPSDRMQSCELSLVILLTVVTFSGQYVELPKPRLTLEPPFPEIFTGEAVTLRCGVQGGSADWEYLWYKDREDTPVLQTPAHIITGDSFTISAAAGSDQGQYWCRGQRGDPAQHSQLSDPVKLTVFGKDVILQTPPQPVFDGDTLRCRLRVGNTANRVVFYRNSKVLQAQPGTALDEYRFSKSEEGSYKCRAWWGSSSFQGESAEVRVSVRDEAKPRVTLEPPFPEIFTGEAVTLRCGVQGGSADWEYLWYKDREDTPVLQTPAHIITGDSFTISAAAGSDQGQYWCRGQRGDPAQHSQLSDPVRLNITDKNVILQTPPQPVFDGDTLRCRLRVGNTANRVVFYKNSKVLQAQPGTALDEYHFSKSEEGSYKCRAWWGSSSFQGESAEVRVSVRELPKPRVTLEPPFPEIFTGEAVTLRCGVQGGSADWEYLWYKDREDTPVLQTPAHIITGDSFTISAAAGSDQGQYWCRGQRGDPAQHSQISDPVRLNITELLSWVTLTASPGATVKEGEALNLTCEAAVNKTPRPQLHYSILRDGEPVTNSTDSALYSTASTEKSHAGSYTCAVESQGVRKSSTEILITVEPSWQNAFTAAYRSSFTLLVLTVFTLLLLQYCRIQGSLCYAGAKTRKTKTDQDQDESAMGPEHHSRVY